MYPCPLPILSDLVQIFVICPLKNGVKIQNGAQKLLASAERLRTAGEVPFAFFYGTHK